MLKTTTSFPSDAERTPKAPGNSNFLTPEAKLAFLRLRQAFTEASILYHFDPEQYIWMETDASGYAIDGILSQLTPESGQWYPIDFFSKKMIPTETRYKTHDQELLVIVEAFKTWRHYLEGCKFEILLLTDHNNLRRFMDTKSLSLRQVKWAQELSRYHFRIDYGQGKANAVVNALSRFYQKSQCEEEELRTENTQIFHPLQSSLTNVSLSGLSLSVHITGSQAEAANLLPLHQILICNTYILPQLCQFREKLHGELASKGPYQQASIGGLKLRLFKLQAEDQVTREIRQKDLKEGWAEIKGVLQFQGLPYMPEIIGMELISRHHDDPLGAISALGRLKNQSSENTISRLCELILKPM